MAGRTVTSEDTSIRVDSKQALHVFAVVVRREGAGRPPPKLGAILKLLAASPSKLTPTPINREIRVRCDSRRSSSVEWFVTWRDSKSEVDGRNRID